jgi:transporter family protein
MRSLFPAWLVYSFGALVSFGVWGVLARAASEFVGQSELQLLFTIGICGVVMVTAVVVRPPLRPENRSGYCWAFLTGLIGSLGCWGVLAALHQAGKPALINTITAAFPIMTMIGAMAWLGERPNPIQILGVVLVVLAVVALSLDVPGIRGAGRLRWALLTRPWMYLAVATLLLWGLTGITQKLATNRMGAVDGFIAFGAAFPLTILAVFWCCPPDWAIPARAWLLGIAGGVFYGAGALATFAAYRFGGRASIVTGLVALSPAIAALLAYAFLDERLRTQHIGGICLAVLAALALVVNPAKWAWVDKQTGSS